MKVQLNESVVHGRREIGTTIASTANAVRCLRQDPIPRIESPKDMDRSSFRQQARCLCPACHHRPWI